MSNDPRGRTATRAAPRQPRPAEALSEAIPGARTLRVSPHQRNRIWPSPYARARNVHGSLLPLTRTLRALAARWIMRAHPERNRAEAHDLNLATAELQPTPERHPADAGRR